MVSLHLCRSLPYAYIPNERSISTRLSDTAVYRTKCHTDPTVTHGDNVVNAVSKLANTISTFAGNRKNNANMTDLKTLAQMVQSLAEQNKHHMSLPVHAPRLPEVSDVKDVTHWATQPQAVRKLRVTTAVKSPSVCADHLLAQVGKPTPEVPETATSPSVLAAWLLTQMSEPAPRVPGAVESSSVQADELTARVNAFMKEEMHDAPVRVGIMPTVKSVLQRVPEETMNSQVIAERTRSKMKQAAVNQYLNKASGIIEDIGLIANRTHSQFPTTPTQALLVAALAISASFNAQHMTTNDYRAASSQNQHWR